MNISFCCACDGSCNHTGNHLYCEAHNPNKNIFQIYTPYYPYYSNLSYELQLIRQQLEEIKRVLLKDDNHKTE